MQGCAEIAGVQACAENLQCIAGSSSPHKAIHRVAEEGSQAAPQHLDQPQKVELGVQINEQADACGSGKGGCSDECCA